MMGYTDILQLDFRHLSKDNIIEYRIKTAELLMWVTSRKHPVGTRYEIRLGFPIDFGSTQEIAVFTSYSIQNNKEDFINLREPLFVSEGGYYLMYRGEV